MTAPLRDPKLGDEHPDHMRRCSRRVGARQDGQEVLCGDPAVIHVDWGPAWGWTCETHAPEVRAGVFKADDWHNLGSCCGMPGSQWFTAIYEDGTTSSWCSMTGDGLPTAESASEIVEVIAS